MRLEPSNATCLAAELQASLPRQRRSHGAPYRAAVLATQLCALGRRYKRLCERLCGGEEEWGRYPAAAKRIERADKARERIAHKVEQLVRESPYRATVERMDLSLKVCTGTEGTVLL